MSNAPQITYSQIFSLTELISAPLIATVQADFFAAERFVAYLREYGFEPQKGAPFQDFGKLRMVVFQYRTPNGWVEMQVPILSLIPLPLLQVSDADFHYNIRILGMAALSSEAEARDPGVRAQAGIPASVGANPENLYASMAPLRRQTEQDGETPTLVANMDINIRMRQADLPGGIATMLNVMQSAVEGSTRLRVALSPDVATISQENSTATFTARVRKQTGEPDPGHLIRFSLSPEFEFLAPPVVTAGTEADRPSRASVQVYTDADGQAAIRVELAGQPRAETSLNVIAESELGFESGQYGPEQGKSLLQILPPNGGKRP